MDELESEQLIRVLEERLCDEKKEFCRDAAIHFQSKSSDWSPEHCWKLAENLWNKKPSHL